MTNIKLSPRVFLPKQKEVLDACRTFTYILYSGAFGAGKTLLLSNIVIRECIKHPNSLWLVGSQTVPQLRDTVLRTFREEVELYQDALRKNKVNINLCKGFFPSRMSYEFFNGSEVLFRSCDDYSKFKSLNLDGFALDEPVDIHEDVFLMLQGRMRASHTKHHLGVMAGNPAGKTNWVYQKFFENPTEKYKVVQTTTYDNTFLNEVAPNYISDMEESYDADYTRRYLRGEWGSFEGMVYKDFSYDKHVGDFRDEPVKYYIGGYDDGFRNPCCLLTLGVTSDNKLYIVDEMFKTELVDSEKAEEVVVKNIRYGYLKIYADPSAQSMIEAMRQKNLRVYEANNDIDIGVAKVKSLFKNDLIYIDKSCKHIIKELESYRYEKQQKLTKNLAERPVKKDDHAVDALRYAVTAFNPFRKPTVCGVGHWGK